MDVPKDGRRWKIGTATDVAWIAGRTAHGVSITTAIPRLFDAYASFYEPDGVDIDVHERAVVDELTDHTADQPWWLGYLDTGAHEIVFPRAPKVSLYWSWSCWSKPDQNRPSPGEPVICANSTVHCG